MKKAPEKRTPAGTEMRREYDFAKGVRGKYAGRFPANSVMVVLDPDVAKVFPTAREVNNALRVLAGIVNHSRKSA